MQIILTCLLTFQFFLLWAGRALLMSRQLLMLGCWVFACWGWHNIFWWPASLLQVNICLLWTHTHTREFREGTCVRTAPLPEPSRSVRETCSPPVVSHKGWPKQPYSFKVGTIVPSLWIAFHLPLMAGRPNSALDTLWEKCLQNSPK